MGKIKIKKNDVWIDMTPMSDVMVLLLTFFMLSANFVKNEVVKVVTPASQTMAKVPSSATLDITIDPEGRVLVATDKTVTMEKALEQIIEVYIQTEKKLAPSVGGGTKTPYGRIPEGFDEKIKDVIKALWEVIRKFLSQGGSE